MSEASTAGAPTGVLLAQLGTPDAPTPAALRRYLRQFLSDPRVVGLPRLLWRPLLEGVVLRVRPRRSAALYRRIWTPEGSPLLLHTLAQRDGLAARLGPGFRVEAGMRYGEPAIAGALDRLAAAGCRRLLVLPLFPQPCSATTLSVFDAVGDWGRARPDPPDLVFVRGFEDHPGYVAAVAAAVAHSGFEPSRESPLLVTFHGIPQRLVEEGDPYEGAVRATASALVRALDLAPDAWRLVFQSRFGRARWLAPDLFDVLDELAAAGVRRVAAVAPSFVADCLETLEEIGVRARERFEGAGGEELVLVPCPNASPTFLDALATIVREHVPPAWRSG